MTSSDLDTADIAIYFMLFLFLPIWGLAGLVDWYCHKKSNIEVTTGLKESILHCIMGVQVGVPIWSCLFFRVNGLILMISFFCWLCHEIVAHIDVYLAAPKRQITILEMHAHNYLATIPLYMLVLILIVNWEVALDALHNGLSNHMSFQFLAERHGGNSYVTYYAIFMLLCCIIPYLEEVYRCFKTQRSKI